MKQDIENILISEEESQKKVKELCATLTEEYSGKFPLAIGVLKGPMPLMADLLKHIGTYLEMDCMGVSSYVCSTVSS
ncbi:hypoxanthine phosphoribosyltransferase, partial [Bacillus paralicheniformis]|uniref:phosphoribosyltransferase n=1 Tax=Bacillus paralicheniformis TaxID=1648923 RepID=UPI00284442F1|nr:hypoxanthine phosphoribosyltransferase [Bacillus paralicheniformis]